MDVLSADHQQVVRQAGPRIDVEHLRNRVEVLHVRLETTKRLFRSIFVAGDLLLQRPLEKLLASSRR